MKWPVRLAAAFIIVVALVTVSTPLLVETRVMPQPDNRATGVESRNGSPLGRRGLLPLWRWSPFRVNPTDALQAPNVRHPLGTDILGRDQLARLILGAHVSFLIGLMGTIISLLVGIPLGALSGLFGGLADRLFHRFVEAFYALPVFFILVLIAGLIPLDTWSLAIILGILGWVVPARYMRNETARLRNADFVRYARASGASFRHLLITHLIPNGIAPVVISASFNMANLILVEATLSFLGLGVQPPTPSWGGMILDGSKAAHVAPWLLIPPAIMIFLSIFSYDILSQYLKERFRKNTPGDSLC